MKPSAAYQNTPMYYADAATEYLVYLEKEYPEHFMEAVSQSTQREITVASLRLVAAECADFHLYSELLIQWRDDENQMRRVVPDNMVVIAPRKPVVSTNFAIPFQPAKPFFVMEYVSTCNSRKNYKESYDKYELELNVPYYLLFHPETQELTLFRFNKRKRGYASIYPDDDGSVAIPELELTMKLLDGWVRFWWKEKLLPIPTELKAEVVKIEKENAALRRENADQARLIADMHAELERLRKSAG